MSQFADKNLRLALLDATQEEYSWVASQEGPYEDERKTRSDWPPWSQLQEDDESYQSALEEFLLSLPVPVAKLARIEHLTLDGDRDIYQWVYPSWWDSGDHFVIRDLRGLEQCKGLEYLSLGQGVVEDCSLRPLTSLENLRRLSLCALSGQRDLDCLLELPDACDLAVHNMASSDERAAWQRVVRLRESR